MTLAAEILSDSPIAYWPLDSNHYNDVSGHGRHLTAPGSGVTLDYAGGICDGLIDDGDLFAWVNGGVPSRPGAGLELNGSWTLEAWVREVSVGSSYCGIIAMGTDYETTGAGWLFYYSEPSTGFVLKRNNHFIGSFSGELHRKPSCLRHVVMGFDDATDENFVYIDGRRGDPLVYDFVTPLPDNVYQWPDSATDTLRIGANLEGGTQYADAIFAHLAMYDTWIGPARVKAHWDAGKCRGCLDGGGWGRRRFGGPGF